MILHEARELYDAAKDEVGVLTLRVEHAPGQLAALVQFLGGVVHQAGVYFANLEHGVIEPVAAEIPREAVAATNEGETHGERLLQQADQEHAGTELGQGSVPEEAGADAGQPADADGVVAEPAGEVGSGPGERDS